MALYQAKKRRFHLETGLFIAKIASKPVSRVLSFKTAIYLAVPLPVRSSRLLRTAGPAICSPTALLRIEVTATSSSLSSGGLLPPPFHPYHAERGGIFLLPFS